MLELPLHKSDSLCIASLPNQFPVNLVSADRTTTIDGLGLLTAFGLRYYDTEVVAAPGTRSGEVYSHAFRLTLQFGPYNSDRCLILRRTPVLELWPNSLDYIELSETDKPLEGEICYDLSHHWKREKSIRLEVTDLISFLLLIS